MSGAFKVKVGSKAQVFHGTAERTVGGLKKEDLMQTEKGRIVSKKQHKAGLKAINRLRAAGFVAKKGEFKLFSKKASKKAKAPRRMVTRAMAASRKAKAAATRKAKKNMKRKSLSMN